MNKIIITVGLFIIITVVFAVILVWPKYQSYQVLQINIKEKESELKSRENYFAQVKIISDQLLGYGDSLAKIATALPGDPSLSSLVNFIQENATESGLLLEKVVFGGSSPSKEKGGNIKETKLAFQASGSYASFKIFLSVLEKSSRIIGIESISIDQPQRVGETALSFVVDVRVYSY